MLLAIDSGNSRLKFGLYDPLTRGWSAQGSVYPHDPVQVESALRALQAPTSIAVANVAGTERARMIELACAHWHLPIRWLRAEPRTLGLTNGYDRPDSLGVDRWCALVAAWSRRQAAAVVVGCGTATTVDSLSASGHFAGGMILPGLELMKRSLAAHTAALKLQEGQVVPLPRNTADAIESGCIAAQVGAIERVARTLPAAVHVLIAGGAAARIAAHLTLPHELVPHLVLEGVGLIGSIGWAGVGR